MNKRSMHFFVIHQHPVRIHLMIILVNLIGIIVIIEIIIIITINPPPDIVRNHMNIVVNLIIFFSFVLSIRTIFVFLFCVCVLCVCSLFYTRVFPSYFVQMGKKQLFLFGFFSLLRCMRNKKQFLYVTFCFYVFTLHIQFVL
jgi:hypothetical protein